MLKFTIEFSDGSKATTINQRIGNQAIDLREKQTLVTPTLRETQWGVDVTGFVVASEPERESAPIDDNDIPF